MRTTKPEEIELIQGIILGKAANDMYKYILRLTGLILMFL